MSGTAEQPAVSSFDSEQGYETILPPYGVGAILVCDTPTELEHCKADFLRKQPELGEYGKKYIAELEQQRLLRTDVSECKSLDLVVKMPFYYPLPFEDELIVDLYNIELQLGVICDGEFRALGWIGKDGFQTVAVSREKQLEIGESTPRIDLASILGPGCHQVALRSRHLGEKFYSFFEAQLIPDGDMDRTYTIEFRNELEPDRAFLRWMCRIK